MSFLTHCVLQYYFQRQGPRMERSQVEIDIKGEHTVWKTKKEMKGDNNARSKKSPSMLPIFLERGDTRREKTQ